MSGFVKGQTAGRICGPPRIVGRLTDEQIRDHYTYQARDGFGKEAIEELARTEHKTPEEIRKICGLKERKDSETMVTPEIKAAIIADARAGLTAKTIAAKCEMNEKAVEYHLCEARKRGELPPAKRSSKKHKKPEPVIEESRTVVANGERVTLPPDDPEPIPDKHPEAYPGQIYDEEPEPEAVQKANDRTTNVWEQLAFEVSDYLCGLLGAGTQTIAVSYKPGKAKATVKTPDGKSFEVKIKEGLSA